MAATEEEFYQRRGDRAPEKEDFHRLPVEDKRLICQLRSAVDVARDKVTTLRDEVEDKELDISREAALRRAAEIRLEQLVDMYGDPSVMEELRERLPRAGKGDARTRLQQEIEELAKKETVSLASSVPGKRRTRRNLEVELEGQIISNRSRKTRSLSSESAEHRTHRKGSTHESDEESASRGHRNRSHSPPEQRPQNEGYRRYPNPGVFGSPFHGYYPPMYTYPPPAPVMYAPPMMSAGATPMMAAGATPMMHAGATPMMHAGATPMMPAGATPMMAAGATPMMHAGATPMAQSTPSHPGMAGVYTPQQHPGVYTPQQHPGGMAGIGSSHSVGVSTGVTSQGVGGANHSQQITTHTYTPSHSEALAGNISGRANISVSDSGMGVSKTTSVGQFGRLGEVGGASDVKAVSVSREQQRQISVLLAELNASKELVKQLTEKLKIEERQVESLMLVSKTQDAAKDAENGGKISEMVEEIYRAQKTRDESILGRMRVANEDRDEALLKLENTKKGLIGDDINKLYLHEDSRSLKFSRLETEKISGSESKLLETITSRRQRRHDISTEEMKAVLQDRDAIMAKCRQLEAEVLKLKRIHRARSTDQQHQANQDKPSKSEQAKLLATQQERDIAMAQVRKLEEELQTLQVYYSLHKSLSQEANLRDQFNNTLKNIQGAVKERDSTIVVAHKENNHLLAQIKSLVSDKTALLEQVHKAEAARKEAEMNHEESQRLVNVLRRKIGGLGTKIEEC